MAIKRGPNKPKAYHRRTEEDKNAWDAFCIYRILNPEIRTFELVAEKSEGKWTEASIAKWASIHDWGVRIAAWDEEQTRQKRWKEFRALEDMNKRQMSLGIHCQTLAMKELRKLMTIADKSEDLAVLSPAQLVQIANFGTSLERVARGAPTEITELQSKEQEVDLSKLSLEDLKKLREIKKKLK